MFCLETYIRESDNYRILISRAAFKECAKIIEKEAREVVHVQPGAKILGTRIIGVPPIPVGLDEDNSMVMIPYTKPCYGTAVVELPVDSEEIKKIRLLAI